MDEPYLGTISMVAFPWAPDGWFPCDGRLLPIRQYSALFALLGTTFGGDGSTTFGLPDFRGRIPVAAGGDFAAGELGGTETVDLALTEIPMHNHLVAASAAGGRAGTNNPTGAVPAGGSGQNIYATLPDQSTMAPQMIGLTGGSDKHNNCQPSLGINFIIAYSGLFPPRP